MFKFSEEDKIFVLPSSTAIGKRGEDIVAKDLMTQGFFVYVSLSHISPCDMVIQKGDELFSVQVKTRTSGKVQGQDRNAYDLLARVNIDTGAIGYAWKRDSLPRLLAAKENPKPYYKANGGDHAI